jgi:phytoene dehydrogenase-like protein
MKASFFDVVVVGARLGSLVAGALLARRGFRVLVLGHTHRPATYEVNGVSLPRESFHFLAAQSPVARRIFSELALQPLFRRHATALDPSLQIALPGHRFDLPLDDNHLEREIEREFPEVKRPVDDFHRFVHAVGAQLDRLLERDMVWPPETFLERREFARASAHQPFDRSGNGRDPLGELPDDHPFRTAVRAPVALTTGEDPEQSSHLSMVRLYGAWLRGAASVDGDYAWLESALFSRIEAHSGQVRLREKAERILLRRNAPHGVRLAGSGEEIGCSFVVAGCDLSEVLELVPDRTPFEALFERRGEPQPRYYRYALNLLLAAEGVPEGMGRHVVIVRDRSRPLHDDNAVLVTTHAPDDEGRRLLRLEMLLPRQAMEGGHHPVATARERLLASAGQVVPFLGRHVMLVDSPHDGRDVQDMMGKKTIPAPAPWDRGPATMPVLYRYPTRAALGLGGLPVRTPIRRLLLCNEQVVPGLGMEGSLLAAWSAARVVQKSDRQKAWMRRGRFSRAEM